MSASKNRARSVAVNEDPSQKSVSPASDQLVIAWSRYAKILLRN